MRDPSFVKDFEFGNRYMPIIRPILSEILSPVQLVTDRQEDLERNSDLLCVSALPAAGEEKPIRIGIRGRRYEYFERYPDDFTHKIGTYTGYEAEFQKIHDHGFGDVFFYFFENRERDGICSWFLASLDKEREYVADLRKQYPPGMTDLGYFDRMGKVRAVVKEDPYGNAVDRYYFVTLSRKDMPEGFVIASSDDGGWAEGKTWVRTPRPVFPVFSTRG